ncbi:putative pentatricopeptide repeat-containing protein [Sesamum angolense]|uniref:Pentatricopeptide repeat-containing protein n=1 Tax=Sesamum angolense TaxID=2727404 RepID=A0AAE2C7E1_9LAMI|nr:putative pentatricopeptide repeat-containing protein [Sesamum angolense]
MAAKNISRTSLHRRLPPPIHHQYSTATSASVAAATKMAAWYTPPASRFNPILQDQDTVLTALSQAIQNSPSKPLPVSLKSLLPSLKPQHVINLISLNPYSLSASSLFSFFTWLSSPGNSTFRHTLHSYCTMIHFLCTHQMFLEAKSLIQVVVSRKGKDSASDVFAAILDTKGTQRSDIYVFSGLMTAYLESGFVLDAIECFRLAKKHKFRVPFDTCRKVLEHLMKLRSFKLVWGFYKEILECGYPASLYFFNILMHRFCREGEMRLARSVFDGIKRWGLRPSDVSFNTLINGYVRQGDLDEGFRLKNAMQASGIEPDVYTYSVLINGMCRERRMDDANELFNEMLDHGLVPNDVTYTTLIDGHCKNGRVDLGMELYQKMLNQGLVPDLITYNTLINGLCRKGDLKEARDLVDEISAKGLKPDKITYTALIDGSWRGVDAERMLREMLSVGLKPDDGTYTMIINDFCKKGDLKTASKLLREMQRDGHVPSVVTYNVLMNGYCKQGQMKNANMLLNAMLNIGVVPDDITYNILLEGYCKNGNREDVSNLRSAKGLILDYASYMSLIGSLRKAPKFHSKR